MYNVLLFREGCGAQQHIQHCVPLTCLLRDKLEARAGPYPVHSCIVGWDVDILHESKFLYLQ